VDKDISLGAASLMSDLVASRDAFRNDDKENRVSTVFPQVIDGWAETSVLRSDSYPAGGGS